MVPSDPYNGNLYFGLSIQQRPYSVHPTCSSSLPAMRLASSLSYTGTRAPSSYKEKTLLSSMIDLPSTLVGNHCVTPDLSQKKGR